MTKSVWYAGRWRTPAAVERHRRKSAVRRMRCDLASVHAKRNRRINESRTP